MAANLQAQNPGVGTAGGGTAAALQQAAQASQQSQAQSIAFQQAMTDQNAQFQAQSSALDMEAAAAGRIRSVTQQITQSMR